LTNLEVLGQQQNVTNATATISNQTGSAAENQTSAMADLTRSDFNQPRDNLNAAREAIQHNDPAGAVSELGSADTEVNILMTRLGGDDKSWWATVSSPTEPYRHGSRCLR
jgi:hypothetical protein